MSAKRSKHLDALRSRVAFEEGEEHVGAFLGRTRIKWLWVFVVGPLVLLTLKQYQVMVTSKRIVFGRLSLMGQLASVDAFELGEIEAASFKKGVLTYRIAFEFDNGRRLVLDANHKAAVSIEGFLFESNVKEFLTKAIA